MAVLRDPVVCVKYDPERKSNFLVFKLIVLLDLLVCIFGSFLQATPPSSVPIQQPPVTRQQEVLVERQTGE